jgi:hypothetical protein
VEEAASLEVGGSEDVDSFTSIASRIRTINISWGATNASTMPSNNELFNFPI